VNTSLEARRRGPSRRRSLRPQCENFRNYRYHRRPRKDRRPVPDPGGKPGPDCV